MPVYLGRPGSLVALPSRGLSVQPGLLRVSEGRTTIGGGRSRDYAPGVLRTWTLRWNVLDRALYGAIEAFFAGLNGPGPHVLLDPGRTNLLTANQSGATSVSNDTSGFSATGAGELLTSQAAVVERGPRALSWSLPAAVTSGVLTIAAPNADWPGIPAVPGRSYRLQARVRGGGTDPIVDLLAAHRWLDAAGVPLSLDTGATVTTAAATWATASVTATCPAGGVYLIPRLVVTAASVTAAAIVYVDQPQLSMPDALDDGTVWRPGLGVPRVSLPQLDDAYWWVSLHKTGLLLEEVS